MFNKRGTFIKILTIGIILVVVGCSILGWLIKESYKNFKDKSTKSKVFHFAWVVLDVLLDTSGLIIIFGLILLGVVLIIYHPLLN